MRHLVDAHRYRQDDDIVLTGIDGHAVAVAHAEPFLRHLGHLVAALANGVLVIQDVAFHLQVWAVLDLDREAVAYRTYDGYRV